MMGNVQVRLPDDLEADLDRLAEELHTSRSEAVRNAIAEGLSAMLLDRALSSYAAGDFSLERGSEYAKVSLYRFAEEAAKRGIPYFRYSPEEAEKDAAVAARFLKARKGQKPE